MQTAQQKARAAKLNKGRSIAPAAAPVAHKPASKSRRGKRGGGAGGSSGGVAAVVAASARKTPNTKGKAARSGSRRRRGNSQSI